MLKHLVLDIEYFTRIFIFILYEDSSEGNNWTAIKQINECFECTYNRMRLDNFPF